MKVIDLLNKIANGEEVPKEIRLGEETDIFYYQDNINSYKTYYNEYLMCDYLCNTANLNDEVEIIEEDNKIEKLDMKEMKEDSHSTQNEIMLGYKINEIIDKLNKGE